MHRDSGNSEDIASSFNAEHLDLGFRFADPEAPRPNPRRRRKSSVPSSQPVELDSDPFPESFPDFVADLDDSPSQGVGQFAFAEPPPGARPGGASRIPPSRTSRGPASRVASDPRTTQEDRAPSSILFQDWSLEYETSLAFTDDWFAVTESLFDWPQGYKVLNGKLYFHEKLCVPESLVSDVLRIHHEWVAHIGNDRLVPEVHRRYHLPPGTNVEEILQDIRRLCLVCQACERPNFSRRRPIAMTPVPDRFFASVCLDIFQMPNAEWQGQVYDAFLMCVDRHSGWMIARPTQYVGLTGEKAAYLLLDSAWGEVGVPSIITTDLGAHFVKAWFKALCSRLGIRVAYSQAHHHQANGRAEVAGRVIKDVLRKLLLDSDLNWVEALPRALRVQHDMVDPVTKLSPYEIVFGRERALAGLPWGQSRDLPDIESFFARMQSIDENVARMLNESHQKLEDRINAKRAEGPSFQVGDWVWYLRPKGVGGVKLQTWWQGPFKVLRRAGEHSFRLRTPQKDKFDAHQSQLKPCVWDEPGALIAYLRYPDRDEVCDGDGLGDPLPSACSGEVVRQMLAEP